MLKEFGQLTICPPNSRGKSNIVRSLGWQLLLLLEILNGSWWLITAGPRRGQDGKVKDRTPNRYFALCLFFDINFYRPIKRLSDLVERFLRDVDRRVPAIRELDAYPLSPEFDVNHVNMTR